jgi:hypothetical protein
MLLAVLGLPLATNAPWAAAAPARDTAPPNDATQARLRVSQCVNGGPAVDVYVNGQVAVNGGVPLTNIGALDWTGYLYLTPGTYSVALVPTGQGLDHAVLGPLDVAVVAGHRYSLAALGQADEPSHPPLLLDETAAYQAAGRSPADFGASWINNVRGVSKLHFMLGNHDVGGAPYGGFKADTYAPSLYKGLFIKAADQVMDSADVEIFPLPAVDQLDCFGGSFPGKWDTHTAAYTSALGAPALLQADSAVSAQSQGQIPSFSTFLGALQTTGLTDMLVSGGPYLLFVPTDAAFAALPAAQRQALLADPQALADMVRAHVGAGYYPAGSLGLHGVGGGFDRTVTNMLGANLVLTGGEKLIVNGEIVAGGGDYSMVANGTRLFWISKLILPLPATPAPTPGMPTTGAGANPADLLVILGAGLALLLAGGLLRRRGVARRSWSG